jgi:hypothetical protein
LSSSGLTALIGGPGNRNGSIPSEKGAAWVFTSETPESP